MKDIRYLFFFLCPASGDTCRGIPPTGLEVCSADRFHQQPTFRNRPFHRAKDVQAFLISLKAGGVGLNLTQADYVFIIDPWWNPAAESQAIARAHRIGQDKQVIAYRFITQNSIEEKILQLQEDKRRLAETFITDSEALPALSNEQWADLLK